MRHAVGIAQFGTSSSRARHVKLPVATAYGDVMLLLILSVKPKDTVDIAFFVCPMVSIVDANSITVGLADDGFGVESAIVCFSYGDHQAVRGGG